MQNRISIDFADGEYTFALPLPRIDELQRKCGVGIGALYARVLKGAIRVGSDVVMMPAQAEFHAADLVETIRQGLIGGGTGQVDGQEVKVTPALANTLVEKYVLDRPLAESWSVAASILGACIVGYEPEKKAGPAKAPAKRKKTRKAA